MSSDEQNKKLVCDIVNRFVIPTMVKYKEKREKTLWYLSSGPQGVAVLGPIKFDQTFFRGVGYSEDSIKQILTMIMKMYDGGGFVVTMRISTDSKDPIVQNVWMDLPTFDD